MIEKPNSFIIPYELIDKLIEQKWEVIKITLLVARETLKFEGNPAIPYSYFEKFMSRPKVSDGINGAIEAGLIQRIKKGTWKGSCAEYKINWEEKPTSKQNELVNNINLGTSKNDELVNEINLGTSSQNLLTSINKIDKIDGYRELIDFNQSFKDTFGLSLKPYRRGIIEEFFRDPGISQELVCLVISKMSEQKRKIIDPGAYLTKVLSNCISEGIITQHQFLESDIKRLIGEENGTNKHDPRQDRGNNQGTKKKYDWLVIRE
jgi:hypothetical protein